MTDWFDEPRVNGEDEDGAIHTADGRVFAPESWEIEREERARESRDVLRRMDAAANGSGRRKLVLTAASDVNPRPLRYLFEPYVPLGKLTILAGAGGQGKSQTTCLIAAATTTGDLPGSLQGTPARALMVSAEDDPEDTIVPRLAAAGADLERVSFIDMRDHDEDGRPIPSGVSLPGDAGHIRQAVENTGARLIVLDPVTGLLDDNHSSWNGQQVRRALAPLADLAREHACAVVCVMHPNKASGTNALARIADSGAFTQLARSVLFQGPDPADPAGERGQHKVLAVPKANLAGPGQHALALAIQPATVPSGHGPIATSRVVIVGPSEATADDVLNASNDEAGALGEARAFLRAELADGARLATEIKTAARDADIAERTLRRARELECVCEKEHGARGKWTWALKVAIPPGVGQLGHLGHLAALLDQGVQEDQEGSTENDVGQVGDDDSELLARADRFAARHPEAAA